MKRNDISSDTRSTAQAATASTMPRDRAERLFIGRLRQALDESASALPSATLDRLALARKTALRAHHAPAMRLAPTYETAPAGFDGPQLSPRLGYGRAGLVASAIVLVGACLAGLYQFEQDRRIEDLADVDSALLNDDLPIAAYADHGFNAFIKQNP